MEFQKCLEADLDVDTRDEKGNTMLCVACQNGLKRMAKIVLKNGADMNVQNNLGNTPLHFCFQYGFAELGAYLITKGADTTICNNRGALCTDGLGLRAMKLFQDAKAERENIENGTTDDGQDIDDLSTVGSLTDRSDYGGMYTDRSNGNLTDRSSGMYTDRGFDTFYTIDEGDQPYTIEEGNEEECMEEEQQQEYYEGDEQQQALPVVQDSAPPNFPQPAIVQPKKQRTWRPLPKTPMPRPLPKGPRPEPKGPRPGTEGIKPKNTDGGPPIAKKVSPYVVSTAPPGPAPKAQEPVPEKLSADGVKGEPPSSMPTPKAEDKISFKYNSLVQAVQAKDKDEIGRMVVSAPLQDIDAAVQACGIIGGAFALPVLMPKASHAVLHRCLGTAASNNRLRTVETLLEFFAGNEVVSNGDGAETAGNRIRMIDMPDTLQAIDRALSRAAAHNRSTASKLLAGYASSEAIVNSLCTAAHHKNAKVVKRLLPWGESKALDQLIGTTSSSGDADVMLLLIPYLSTDCGQSVIDQGVESASAKGHIAIVGILWRFASKSAQERVVAIAKHYKHDALVAEIQAGDGVFEV